MRTPSLAGVIERRVLVNYRADPDVAAAQVPPGFTPQLANGFAIVGICLIELRVHPAALPSAIGVRSFNGAHRLAVIDPDGRPAVYIPRRDSSSRIVSLVGGRRFPAHHRASLRATQTGGQLHITLDSIDRSVHVTVTTSPSTGLPADSAFTDVAEASRFFERATIGYSDNASGDRLDCIELRAAAWAVEPLHIDHVESSYFDDPQRFPATTITPDHALLMTDVHHTWHVHASRPIVAEPAGR